MRFIEFLFLYFIKANNNSIFNYLFFLDEQIPGVLALEPETIIPKVINENENENKKNSTLMMLDIQKPSKDTEIKKKPTINTDIIKTKNETKYQNIKKEKDKLIIEITTVPLPTTTLPNFMTTMEATVTTTTTTTMPEITEIFTEASTESSTFIPTEMTSMMLNDTTTTTTSQTTTTTEDVYSPLLLDGEPIANLTTTTEEPTSQPAAEDENMSRARALNISASEPTNSLQANLTDLSDVSMDDDEDRETEGRYRYIPTK